MQKDCCSEKNRREKNTTPLLNYKTVQKRNSRFAEWKMRLFSSGGHLMTQTNNNSNQNSDAPDDIIARIKSTRGTTLLSDEEFAILYMRFGITSGKAVTHSVIADVLGKTTEYIIQTERDALMKMRDYCSN
jgi:DNA-directed RNA polymerase sigma subunit (sigma70/sigma32)